MAREREIGMLLEHPNIARLYDAGVDERGRPYLALEFIDGQPIDAWREAQGLNVRDAAGRTLGGCAACAACLISTQHDRAAHRSLRAGAGPPR